MVALAVFETNAAQLRNFFEVRGRSIKPQELIRQDNAEAMQDHEVENIAQSAVKAARELALSLSRRGVDVDDEADTMGFHLEERREKPEDDHVSRMIKREDSKKRDVNYKSKENAAPQGFYVIPGPASGIPAVVPPASASPGGSPDSKNVLEHVRDQVKDANAAMGEITDLLKVMTGSNFPSNPTGNLTSHGKKSGVVNNLIFGDHNNNNNNNENPFWG